MKLKPKLLFFWILIHGAFTIIFSYLLVVSCNFAQCILGGKFTFTLRQLAVIFF